MEYPNTKKKNFFLHVGDFFLNIGKGFVNQFVKFGTRFKEGSLGTKMSHFIMGSGNFYHKRITKGIIYLLLQIGFILVMVLNPKVNNTPIGYKAIVNFFTLGTNEGGLFTGPTDNRHLYLHMEFQY